VVVDVAVAVDDDDVGFVVVLAMVMMLMWRNLVLLALYLFFIPILYVTSCSGSLLKLERGVGSFFSFYFSHSE
jgi:hypothetical protein